MTSCSARSLNLLLSSVLLIGVAKAAPNGFVFNTIAFPGASNTNAYGVNNIGQIVGLENASIPTLNGFLLSEGTFTTFSAPPSRRQGAMRKGSTIGDMKSAGGER